MRKLFFVFLYLFMLSSVFALRTCWTSGDPAEAADYHSVSTEPQSIGLMDEAEQIFEEAVYAAKKGGK